MDKEEVGSFLLVDAEHYEAEDAGQQDKKARGKTRGGAQAQTAFAHFFTVALLFSIFLSHNGVLRLWRKTWLVQLMGEKEGEEAREKEEGAGD